MQSFKTQVLLLHSQQSTLDRFSESLGDAYSVHLATTGTDALNTLGLTPIHIMVTAQELSGMSGVEALREARRHSPDTVGILIAPEEISGTELEALVGGEQIFQVIRGVATPEEMRHVIDAAVDRMRMDTLHESANDRTAGPRARIAPTAPAAPVRRPSRPAPAPPPIIARPSTSAGDTTTEVVVLSKDDVFIETIRQALGPDRTVHGVRQLRAAAEHIVEDGSTVLVTDAAVAPRAVEALTKRLRRRQPGLVTIVAGRRDDGDQLMGLVNEGMIYRFLLKPISPGRARLALEAAMRRARETAPAAAGPSTKQPTTPPAKSPAQPSPSDQRPPERLTPSLEDFEDAEEVVLSEEPAQVVRLAIPIKPPAPAVEPKRARARPSPRLQRRGPSRSWSQHLRVIGLLLGVTAAAAVWYQSRPSGVAEVPPASETIPDAAATVDPNLLQARAARSDGRLLTPGSDGALPLYAAALRRDPSAPAVREEIRGALADAYARVETALDEGRIEAARGGRAVIAAAFPGSPRLAAVDARLTATTRDRLLRRADEQAARGEIGTALATLDEAEALAPGRDPAVAAKRDTLLAVADDREDTLLLELGNQRLLQKALVEPAGDNARYFYGTVLARDGASAEGLQGMAFVRTALVSRIRDAIDADDRRAAERWLEEAGLSGVDESRLQKLRRAADRLPGVGAATTADLLPPLNPPIEEAGSRPAMRAAPAPAPVSPDAVPARQTSTVAMVQDERGTAARLETAPTADTGQPLATVSGNAVERNSVPAPIPVAATREVAAGAVAANEVATGEVATAAGVRPDTPPDTPRPATAEKLAPDPAATGSTLPEATVAAIASPERITYREPVYPRMAEKRGIEGWVDVEFRLSSAGEPTGTRIVAADPVDVFEDAALAAVADWRYRPPSDAGWPGDRPLRIRIHFGIEER
ncbi:MAG: TonB family protein [Gammaproteobacteria bacterium]